MESKFYYRILLLSSILYSFRSTLNLSNFLEREVSRSGKNESNPQKLCSDEVSLVLEIKNVIKGGINLNCVSC